MSIVLPSAMAPHSDSDCKTVVLLSGGLDSATTLALCKALDPPRGVYAITFRYGQRHAVEVAAAKAIAVFVGVRRHLIVDVDLRAIGGSSLTSDERAVSKSGPVAGAIPSTYVPARNTIFLSLALGWAETLGADEIVFGANALDYSGYPDCRPEYVDAFERLAALATRDAVEGRCRVKIRAPLMHKTKAEIVTLAGELGLEQVLGLTSSCYDPTERGACGLCDSCRLRLAGFASAGVVDPARYA